MFEDFLVRRNPSEYSTKTFFFSCTQAASRVRRNWRLSGTTLYVTMEPCVMCLSAAQVTNHEKNVFLLHRLVHS